MKKNEEIQRGGKKGRAVAGKMPGNFYSASRSLRGRRGKAQRKKKKEEKK